MTESDILGKSTAAAIQRAKLNHRDYLKICWVKSTNNFLFIHLEYSNKGSRRNCLDLFVHHWQKKPLVCQ